MKAFILCLILSLPTFLNAQSASPTRILFADINGDGIPDKLVVSSGTLVVYDATSAGVFNPTPTVLLYNVQDAAAGNFRGSGINDLAILSTQNVSSGGGNGSLFLLLNDGTGTFSNYSPISVSTLTAFDTSCRVAEGDFSGNLHVDLAVICPAQGLSINVGVNDGVGNFHFIAVNTQTVAPQMQSMFQTLYDELKRALQGIAKP
jgi:hypothetical protein